MNAEPISLAGGIGPVFRISVFDIRTSPPGGRHLWNFSRSGSVTHRRPKACDDFGSFRENGFSAPVFVDPCRTQPFPSEEVTSRRRPRPVVTAARTFYVYTAGTGANQETPERRASSAVAVPWHGHPGRGSMDHGLEARATTKPLTPPCRPRHTRTAVVSAAGSGLSPPRKPMAGRTFVDQLARFRRYDQAGRGTLGTGNGA